MGHFAWPEVGIAVLMIGNLALQLGIVVAGVRIGLTLWHRRKRLRE
jgi:hypothetical protein